MERYDGVKFGLVPVDETLAESDLLQYLVLDGAIGKSISTCANEGNMSKRLAKGFLIKKAGSQMSRLGREDVVFVKKVDHGSIHATGRPSSESMMHHEIYSAREDVNSILHFHDDALLKKIESREKSGWVFTGTFPYGTMELARAAARASIESSFIALDLHGLLICAKDDAQLLSMLSRCKDG
jgi:hypothetical protein